MSEPLTDDLIARLMHWLDTVPIQYQPWMSQHAGLIREAAEALAAASRPREQAHIDAWVNHVPRCQCQKCLDNEAASRPQERMIDEHLSILREIGASAVVIKVAEEAARREEATRASASSAAPPPWQPIETAPKDGTVVLLWGAGFDRRYGYLWAWIKQLKAAEVKR